MKVTIEYDSERDGADAASLALSAPNLQGAFWAILEELRSAIKYPRPDSTDEYIRGLETAREVIWDALRDRDVANVVDGLV